MIESTDHEAKDIQKLLDYIYSQSLLKGDRTLYEYTLILLAKYELHYSDFEYLLWKVAEYYNTKLLTKNLSITIVDELIECEYIDFKTLAYMLNNSYRIEDTFFNLLKDQKEALLKIVDKNDIPFQFKMRYLYKKYYDDIYDFLIDQAMDWYDKIEDLFSYDSEKMNQFLPYNLEYINCNDYVSRSDVEFVDHDNSADFMEFVLKCDFSMVAMDCEWIIDPLQYSKNCYLSTIQLAFAQNEFNITKVFVVDAYLLEVAEICDLITNKILLNNDIKLLGYDLEGDIKNYNYTIRKCHPDPLNKKYTVDFYTLTNLVDLYFWHQNKYGSTKGGLKRLCKNLLGKELEKYEQVSCWENRPLREAQLHYACLDVVTLILLFEKTENLEEFDTDNETENKMYKNKVDLIKNN